MSNPLEIPRALLIAALPLAASGCTKSKPIAPPRASGATPQAAASAPARSRPEAPTRRAAVLKAMPMAGPLPDIAAVCKAAARRAPNPEDPCVPVTKYKPRELWPKVKLRPPFVDLRLLAFMDPDAGSVIDAAAVVAVKTKRGWFYRSWQWSGTDDAGAEYQTRFGDAEVRDLVGGGAPELIVKLSYSRTATIENGGQQSSVSTDSERLLVCGLGASGLPSCLAPLPRAGRQTTDDDQRVSWKLRIIPAPGGLRLTEISSSAPAAVKERPRRYRVVFPSRTRTVRRLSEADIKKLPASLAASALELDRAQSFVVKLRGNEGALFISGTALTGRDKGKLRALLVARRKILADISARWREVDREGATIRAVAFRDLDGDGARDVTIIVRTARSERKAAAEHAFCYGWIGKKLEELHSDSGRRLHLAPVMAEVACSQACTSYGACDEEVNGGTYRGGAACVAACRKKPRRRRREWLRCVFGSSCEKVVNDC